MFQTRQELLSNNVFHRHALFCLKAFSVLWANMMCKLGTAWDLKSKLAWFSKCTQVVGSGFWCRGALGRVYQAWLMQISSLCEHSCLQTCSLAYLCKVKKKAYSLFGSFCIENYSRTLVSVFTHGVFIVSGLLPKGMRAKEERRIKCSPACSSFLWSSLLASPLSPRKQTNKQKTLRSCNSIALNRLSNKWKVCCAEVQNRWEGPCWRIWDEKCSPD